MSSHDEVFGLQTMISDLNKRMWFQKPLEIILSSLSPKSKPRAWETLTFKHCLCSFINPSFISHSLILVFSPLHNIRIKRHLTNYPSNKNPVHESCQLGCSGRKLRVQNEPT